MGGTLCVAKVHQQTSVVPVSSSDNEKPTELNAGNRNQPTRKHRVSSSAVHPAKTSWQEATSPSILSESFNSSRQDSILASSFRSRQSVGFFRRRSIRPSQSTIAGGNEAGKSLAVSINIDGNLLRKYTVHSVIGKGAFSNVLLIEEKVSCRKFALKIIEKKRSYRTNVPWERELEILKRVHHPNIVNLFETHSTTSKVYFVLELASGGDLQQRLLAIGHFPESRARKLLHQILDALRYLHKHGVTHRDLKLENCLFKSSEEDSLILLSDFGLAYLQPKITESEGMQTTCGTAEYISPEMLEGEIYTQQVDMWSFGIVTFAVLSGKMPFRDQNKARLFKKIREASYSFDGEVWSTVTQSAKDFIDKLICVDVHCRLKAELALKHDWMATAMD